MSISSFRHAIDSDLSLRQVPRYQPLVLCLTVAVIGILIDDRFDFSHQVYIAAALTAFSGWGILFKFLSNQEQTPIGAEPVRPAPVERASKSKATVWKSGIGVLWHACSHKIHFARFRRLVSFQWAAVFLYLGVAATAAFWHHVRWNWVGENDISRFVEPEGSPVCLRATVVSEPRWITPNDSNDGMNYRQGTVRTRLALRAKQLRDGQIWHPVSGQLDLVVQGRLMKIRSGDQIQVSGKLRPLNPPTNPGQFDFQRYYRAQGLTVVLYAYYPDSVDIISPAKISLFRPLSFLRYELNELVWHYLNPDEAAFASAIMLGNREQLSAERRESFLKTGTSHLLAISGLHVGILAGAFLVFFRVGLLSRESTIYATIAFVIFYAWLVEFRPPALRAAVLIVTFCVGKLLGRTGFGFNLLSLAGLILLMLNPRDLFNLGAQLSFLAVATLNFGSAWIFWQPSNDPLDRLIANTRPWPVRSMNWIGSQIRTAFLVSAVIWLVGLPLVAFHFNLIAPVALIVNPFLLLPLAIALYSGLGLITLGFFFSPVANILAKICEWNLSLVENIIQIAEKIPYGHSATSGPTLFAVISFYLGVGLFAVYPATRLRFQWLAVLAITWYVLCWRAPDSVLDWYRSSHGNRLVCTFIDVNHGSSVLLEMPSGKRILYDGGSFGSSVFGYRAISGVLWSERIESLDTVIISHADLDHYNAIPELTSRFSIGEVLATRRTLASNSPSVRALLSRIRSLGIPTRSVDADSVRDSGTLPMDPHIQILNPPRAGTGGNDNSDSLVLLIEVAGFRILLTGDLEGPGLQRLISQPRIKCDLVMAPHHGSFNSDPTEFMNWCQPKMVVISGESSRIRDNAVEVFQQNGRTVFRTDRHGGIRCMIDSGNATIQIWNGRGWQTALEQSSDVQIQGSGE
jgi:competence protein ComEC